MKTTQNSVDQYFVGQAMTKTCLARKSRAFGSTGRKEDIGQM